MMDLVYLVPYFAIYSFIGWVCETIYCSIGQGKFTKRGFLNGPYCPIYGFGALFILLLTEPLKSYPILVFFVGALGASLLEYVTSWLLETVFHMRWWDYSNYRFNIKGRVCLKNSSMFGGLSLIVTYLVHGPVSQFIRSFSPNTIYILTGVIIFIFSIDFAYSVLALLKLKERLQSLRTYIKDLGAYQKKYDWLDVKNLSDSMEKLRVICINNSDTETLAKLDKILKKQQEANRLLRAFPNLKIKELSKELELLRKTWNK